MESIFILNILLLKPVFPKNRFTLFYRLVDNIVPPFNFLLSAISIHPVIISQWFMNDGVLWIITITLDIRKPYREDVKKTLYGIENLSLERVGGVTQFIKFK